MEAAGRAQVIGGHLGLSKKAQPSDVEVQRNDNGSVFITLNRPKALNALTLDMVRMLWKTLQECQRDTSVAAVIIRGAGDRAFCAGGDIRALAEAASRGDLDYPHSFFAEEYLLDCLIHRFNKPYLALLDGITMGGGVGLSIGASHRIVTEHVSFAMPETGIGFFPDVGGTYFLSRLPGGIGIYLALTGQRIGAKDLLYCGVASHYIPRSSLPHLEETLRDGNVRDVDAILAKLACKPEGESELSINREDIDHCFAGVQSVEQIFERLTKRNSTWSQRVLKQLQLKSPASLKITLQGLLTARQLSLEEALQQELRMAMRFMESHDFVEGVRAVIIEKDNLPHWNPVRIDQVTQEYVQHYFVPFTDAKRELWATQIPKY